MDCTELISRYENNPFIRAIIPLIPFGIGSSIETGVLVQYHNIKRKRLAILLDELAKGEKTLTKDVIESEDFIHCFLAVSIAVVGTRRREKIIMFANLLNNSIDQVNSIDEYEEYLKILDELSYRELQILLALETFENKYPLIDGENDLQRTSRFWDDFSTTVINDINVPANELNAVMTRLNRTGCYETFTGMYWDYTGGKGKLTETFFRLKELISVK